VPRFDPRVALLSSVSTLLYLSVTVWAWGDVPSFFRHPVRLGLVVASALLSLAACFSGFSGFSRGQRASAGGTWILVPLAVIGLALAWVPPYGERRGWGTLDGDALRYIGLLAFVVGSLLRLAAVLALGARFSALVALQAGHRLKTDGVYRWVRHPSYLGALLAMAGWVLAFRSGLGLILVGLVVPLVLLRIRDEERFLASAFGEEYQRYRRKTWRLVPWVY
jgi:protein-S-isoprenylcysteine O-methyltransferase Ste14